MLYFDFRKAGESIDELKRCRRIIEDCFDDINSAIEALKKSGIEYAEEEIAVLSSQSEKMAAFSELFRQVINAAEFAHDSYRQNAKKLSALSEKLFLPSAVSDRMQLISLKDYIERMKNIRFEEGNMQHEQY